MFKYLVAPYKTRFASNSRTTKRRQENRLHNQAYVAVHLIRAGNSFIRFRGLGFGVSGLGFVSAIQVRVSQMKATTVRQKR